eukprot:11949751-Alexandrium_andersonii.AAC.1
MDLATVGDASAVRRQVRHSRARALTRQHLVAAQQALRGHGGRNPRTDCHLQPGVTLELRLQPLRVEEQQQQHLALGG